jgi:hypothetical protein
MWQSVRIAALRRFAVAITVLNVFGHTLLGFEQSWAQLLVAVGVAYATELGLEWIGAWSRGTPPAFVGGAAQLIDFLLPAHITGLAVSMLLYANDRLAPFAFAAAVAIASKSIVRVSTPQGSRHVLNPSNTGIAATLLAFSWVGISPPYAFTERVSGAWDVVIPGIIVCSGTFLNARFTRRMPLIIAWMAGFAMQALLRSAIFHTPVVAALLPMSGMAFLLFSFYMISDPGTTPDKPVPQIAFALVVAATYAALLVVHAVFGLFFALFIVCAGRSVLLFARAWAAPHAVASVLVPSAVPPKLDEAA